MLQSAEDASPVDAVEAVTRELGLALDALTVSFLIADLGGRALVRLAHVPLRDADGAAGRRRDDEFATVVPFDGGAQEQALRMQAVQVLPGGAAGGRVGAGDRTRRGHRAAGADAARRSRTRGDLAEIAPDRAPARRSW